MQLFPKSVRSLVRTGFFHPAQITATTASMLRWGPSLAGLYEAARHRQPHEIAVVDDWGACTFADIGVASDALAAGLQQYGLSQDSSIGILCRNSRAFVIAAVATAKLGAGTVYLNTASAGPQLNEVILNEGVDFVIHDAEFTPSGVPHQVVTPRRGDSWWYPGLDEGASLRRTRPQLKPKLPVLLTSGTTGTPKGARRGVPRPDLDGSTALLQRVPYARNATILTSSPLFHAWGAAQLVLAATLGNTLVLRSRFNANECLDDIVRHDVDILATVPVFIQQLLEVPESHRALRRLDAAVSSGAALPAVVSSRWLDEVRPTLYNVYGSTEVGQATIAVPADLARHPGTVGTPAPGCTVEVLDEQRKPVAAEASGAIFVSSGMGFEGYSNGGGKEAVGALLATGDTGFFTSDGCLMVTGRDDDMIITGGENVFPNEIEDCIRGEDGVLDVAVVGVPDEVFGQRLVAFVVPADQNLTPPKRRAKAVQQRVRDNLATYKVPRDVIWTDELPRNPAGKVLRTTLVTNAQVRLESAD